MLYCSASRFYCLQRDILCYSDRLLNSYRWVWSFSDFLRVDLEKLYNRVDYPCTRDTHLGSLLNGLNNQQRLSILKGQSSNISPLWVNSFWALEMILLTALWWLFVEFYSMHSWLNIKGTVKRVLLK